ncbi:ionotropic receptor 21a-like [Macrobrachium nipponense]|uniref:ionotropic receptor 21a-like n=1 Tax=Macrobrachium nipponense TaxID=159736 RepID=UPI0030C7BEB1
MKVPFMRAPWAAFICPRIPRMKSKMGPTYHIWTTLPYTTGNKSIALGVWKPEAFGHWSDLFIDRFRDMGEKMMTVLGFGIDVPLLYAHVDGGQPKGLCFIIFHALSQWLGFHYDVHLTRDTSFHIIEDTVMRGQNDVILNFAGLTPSRYEEFSLTVPYHYEGFGLMLEVPPPLPQWQNFIFPFTWQVWIATLVTILITGIIFHLLNYQEEKSFAINLIIVAQSVLAKPMDNIPERWRVRSFLLMWWLLSWLLELSYFCNLIAVLTIPVFPKKIQTAQELADSRYRVCLLDYGEFVAEALPASTHHTLAALGAKLDLVPVMDNMPNAGEEGCVELVLKGTHSHLETYSYTVYLYSKLGHSSTVYPLKEQIYSNYLAFPVQKDAPWKYKFDEGMQRLFEGGLIKRWMKEAMIEALDGVKTEISSSMSEAKALSLGHLQSAFFILVMGFFVSLVVIIGEFLVSYQKNGSVYG